MKTAIEFCLQTSDTHFLFNELFNFFKVRDLTNVFHERLISLIMANKFQDKVIPESYLKEMLQYHVTQRRPDLLEQLIVRIDMAPYQTVGDESVRTIVEQLCMKHSLFDALLHLSTSKRPSPGCAKVLDLWFSKINKLRALDRTAHHLSLKELSLMSFRDGQTKKKIENSGFYQTYRLLWMIRNFLHGVLHSKSCRLSEE